MADRIEKRTLAEDGVTILVKHSVLDKNGKEMAEGDTVTFTGVLAHINADGSCGVSHDPVGHDPVGTPQFVVDATKLLKFAAIFVVMVVSLAWTSTADACPVRRDRVEARREARAESGRRPVRKIVSILPVVQILKSCGLFSCR